jgi:hypothetical protein
MVKTTRLVDYFVVAGYDHSNHGRRVERGGFTCQGTIIQRFPTKDWPDSPFIGKDAENRLDAALNVDVNTGSQNSGLN